MFRDSAIKAFLDDPSNLPNPVQIPGFDKSLPYVLIADKAYPLRQDLMKSFRGKHLTQKQQHFNDTLNQARSVVERSFGQTVTQFQILKGPIDMAKWRIDVIVLGCFLLHNLIIDKEQRSYEMISETVVDNFVRSSDQVSQMRREISNSESELIDAPNEVRDFLVEYFGARDKVGN